MLHGFVQSERFRGRRAVRPAAPVRIQRGPGGRTSIAGRAAVSPARSPWCWRRSSSCPWCWIPNRRAVSDDIPIRIPDRNSPYQPAVSEPQAPARRRRCVRRGHAAATAGVAPRVTSAPQAPVRRPAGAGRSTARRCRPAGRRRRASRPRSGRADPPRASAGADPAHADADARRARARYPRRDGPVQAQSPESRFRSQTGRQDRPRRPAPDDGSKALALLEGRGAADRPPKPGPGSRSSADARGISCCRSRRIPPRPMRRVAATNCMRPA